MRAISYNVYGPKISFTKCDLVEICGSVDKKKWDYEKKEWVKDFLETENHEYIVDEPIFAYGEYSEEFLSVYEEIFDIEFNDWVEYAEDILLENNLDDVLISNWSKSYIGIVMDQDPLDERITYRRDGNASISCVDIPNKEQMKKVEDFCERYNLSKPTFFIYNDVYPPFTSNETEDQSA